MIYTIYYVERLQVKERNQLLLYTIIYNTWIAKENGDIYLFSWCYSGPQNECLCLEDIFGLFLLTVKEIKLYPGLTMVSGVKFGNSTNRSTDWQSFYGECHSQDDNHGTENRKRSRNEILSCHQGEDSLRENWRWFLMERREKNT